MMFNSAVVGRTNLNSPVLQDPQFAINFAILEEEEAGEDTSTISDVKHPWDEVRLDKSVVPLNYDLRLHPNLTTGTFTGAVSILVHVAEELDHLRLHQNRLNVTRVNVKNASGTEVVLQDHFSYPRNQLYVIRPKEKIGSGQNYSVELEFQGSLLGKIVGLYRSVYFDSTTNETRYLATSQFEPTNARRAFPCFDEPGFKSTFNVRLIHEKSFTALSNMDIVKQEPYDDEELVITSFRQSVPMPTYITCFIVCDFSYNEGFTEGQKPFRVYSRPDQSNYTNLALRSGTVIQDSYANYFNIPFPLPKQDLIAIPDFSAGAMENWGLITYREARLLYHPEHTNLLDKQYLVKIVAHELTHQWFGNLVTMKWWDDIWLNEGFASFFSYQGLGFAEPSWHTEAAIIIEDMQKSFRLDNRDSSHPIVQTVNKPGEIAELFDEISYSKGASVIRMLEGFMGSQAFQEGIQRYLKRHQFSHATTQDLWDAMTQKSRDKSIDVAKVMDTWTRQMGFPVVTVHRNSNKFRITQNRYLIGQTKFGGAESPYNYLWEIPLSYISQSNLSPEIHWIHMEQEVELEIPSLDEKHWIKFNAFTTGYYRVNYDIDEWRRLINVLYENHEALSVSDRTGLLDDAFALAEGGYISYDVPLNMSLYLKREAEYEPWVTASSHIVTIARRLIYTPDYSLYRQYFLGVLNETYERLGWRDAGSHTERKLRSSILNLACALQHEECLQKSSRYLKSWLQNSQSIPPNFFNVMLNYGLKSMGPDTWDQLLHKYLHETSAQNEVNLLKSLASSRYPWQLSSLLESSRNVSLIRTQNFPLLISYVSANPTGQALTWNFIRSNWEELVNRFSLNNRYLGNLIPTVTADFTSVVQLREMQQFFNQYPEAGAGARARLQAEDNVKTNIQWLKDHKEHLFAWLSTHLEYK